jgi:hypothetical protein
MIASGLFFCRGVWRSAERAAVHSCAASISAALGAAIQTNLPEIASTADSTWTELSPSLYDRAMLYVKHARALDRGRSHWNRDGTFVDHWEQPYRIFVRRSADNQVEVITYSTRPRSPTAN